MDICSILRAFVILQHRGGDFGCRSRFSPLVQRIPLNAIHLEASVSPLLRCLFPIEAIQEFGPVVIKATTSALNRNTEGSELHYSLNGDATI